MEYIEQWQVFKVQEWVIRPRKEPSGSRRLFCFPYAGVGASAYRSWVEEASPDLELNFVQYPGRENRIRERPFTRITVLAAAIADAISPLVDRSYAFYGHSVGGKIAFEVVRELRRRETNLPSHLFVGACQAPQIAWSYPELHLLDEEAFIAEMQCRYGGVPTQILDDPELRALLIPTLRADVELLETYSYRPEPVLACDIAVFRGSKDSTVETDSLEAWAEQTNRSFRICGVDGGHFFLQTARREILRTMEGQLAVEPVAVSEVR